MSKQSLLLVDHDTRSMRVLEVSLRKAGFTVTTAVSVGDALEKLVHPPDLIISETTFPADQQDGFELRRRVREQPAWAEIPFIFLTAEQTIENKIKGLELGVDDYLTKPIYIKEIVTRINILLQKRQRVRFEERRDGRTRFAGRVQDMPVVDVIQTIEISRKSGVIQFVGDRGRQAAIYFRDGRVIDAEAGALQGEDAVYRLLTWSDGEFEVVFRTVRRREVITTSSQGLLMEGMRRLDEWSRLLEQLPPLTHRFEVDARELATRLGDVPDDNNAILRLIDGKRTLLEVIDGSDVGDLECLQVISRLYFEEMLLDLDQDKAVRRDSGATTVVSAAADPSDSGPHSASGPVEISEPYPARASAQPSPSGDAGQHPSTGTPTEVALERPSSSIPVDEGDIDEEVEEAEDRQMPGALSGRYRPSSLRLIDEAVAAAQAIEPSLFEDEPATPSPSASASSATAPTPPSGVPISPAVALPSGPVVVSPGTALRGLVRLSARPAGDAGGDDEREPSSPLDDLEFDFPSHIGADDPTPMPLLRRTRAQASKPQPRDEVSGLRMIGSHGRDRAEASGEVAFEAAAVPVTTTQRELVTILPRRSTREVQIVTGEPKRDGKTESAGKPDGKAESAAMPEPAPPPAAATDEAPPVPPEPPAPVAEDQEPARRDDPKPRALPIEPPRTITPIDERSEPTPEPRGRVGRIVLAVIVLAAAAGGVYALAQRGKQSQLVPTVITSDASELAIADASVAAHEIDAASLAVAADAAQLVADPVVDAGVTQVSADAAPELPASPDEQATALRKQATAALAEGDAEKALKLAEASLKLRRTARAHLTQATALQRLDRIDEAIEATHAAERISPDFTLVYDLRGRILWSARRFDEARVAFEQFLALESPTSKRAAEVRRLLDRPQ